MNSQLAIWFLPMQSQQRTFAMEVHVHEHDLPNFQTEVHTTAHVWGGRHVFLLGDPAQLPACHQTTMAPLYGRSLPCFSWNGNLWTAMSGTTPLTKWKLTRGLSSIPQGRGVVWLMMNASVKFKGNRCSTQHENCTKMIYLSPYHNYTRVKYYVSS